MVPIRLIFRFKIPTLALREVVEFSSMIYDVSKKKAIDSFQAFVKPKTDHSLVVEEIEKLKIRQEQIDEAKDIASVLDDFDEFLNKNV